MTRTTLHLILTAIAVTALVSGVPSSGALAQDGLPDMNGLADMSPLPVQKGSQKGASHRKGLATKGPGQNSLGDNALGDNSLGVNKPKTLRGLTRKKN